MTRTVHQGQSRIWHPTQGIVFRSIPLPSEPSPPRALSTIGASNSERNLPINPNTADGCLLKSSLDFSSSNSRYARSSSHGSPDIDGSSCAPSSTSQDSNVGNLGRQDTSEIDREVQDEDHKELHTPLAFQIPQD